jgi:hypothetical protein
VESSLDGRLAVASVGEALEDDDSGGDTDEEPSVSVVNKLNGERGEAVGL